MKSKTNIQWTNYTWNIAVGCNKVNTDCKYCYMFRDSLKGKRYTPDKVRRTKTVFKLPLKIKEPSLIFTSSLTDFFHPDIDNFRAEAWQIIKQCPHHTFQILTKRPHRIAEHLPADWGDGYPNVWLGVSCGHQAAINEFVPELIKVPSIVKFLSIEPLIEQVSIHQYVNHVDWVIIGGESGNKKGKYQFRPAKIEWFESLLYECSRHHTVAVFVKQLGTHLAGELMLSDRHGATMTDWPKQLQYRLMPMQYYVDGCLRDMKMPP